MCRFLIDLDRLYMVNQELWHRLKSVPALLLYSLLVVADSERLLKV